jgi:NAD(P)-dependent dehydrogenase (short-subunit alcohol dehydrogenase family)
VPSEGSSAVVTGAGQGIGRAIARRLIADGWRVVGVEVAPEHARDAEQELGMPVVVGDVADPGTSEEAGAWARQVGRLTAWVNNAGIVVHGTLTDSPIDEVRRCVEVNALGAFWGCRAAVEGFAADGVGGAIVNISSIHASSGFSRHAAYDLSKGAVESLTRYVAVEYGPVGVRCNAVAPGMVLVRPWEELSDDDRAAIGELVDTVPTRRLAEPVEIARVVAFLLSEEASYVSGQVLGVDGGWAAQSFGQPVDPSVAGRFGAEETA